MVGANAAARASAFAALALRPASVALRQLVAMSPTLKP
jgi:hypothetical protein